MSTKKRSKPSRSPSITTGKYILSRKKRSINRHEDVRVDICKSFNEGSQPEFYQSFNVKSLHDLDFKNFCECAGSTTIGSMRMGDMSNNRVYALLELCAGNYHSASLSASHSS